MDVFLKRLGRVYRDESDHAAFVMFCAESKKSLREALKEPVGARGHHVHESRYYDSGIHILGLIEIMVANRLKPARDRRDFLLDDRSQRAFWMTENNGNIRAWLNETASVLGKLLFIYGDGFRFPNSHSPKSEPGRSKSKEGLRSIRRPLRSGN